MTRPSPNARRLARRILHREAGDEMSPDATVEAVGRALRKFHEQLTRLIGTGGFEALEARALDLAVEQHAFLRKLDLPRPHNGGPTLEALLPELDPADARAGAEAVLAHLIDLLLTFLGEEVGGRLLGQGWPELRAENPSDNPREGS